MKRNSIKWLLMAAVMTVGLVSCAPEAAEPAPVADPAPAAETAPEAEEPIVEVPLAEPEPEAAPAEEEPALDDVAVGLRDLGGREIIIADWWTNNEAEEQPPANLREEEERAYRDSIFADYNFTIKQQSVSDWNGYVETYTTSVMADSPTADIYIMSSPWAMQMLQQGLLYPLNTVESLDLSNPKWNTTLTELFTGGDGNAYAISNAEQFDPTIFMYFNKRLFEEAGIDPEEPYNLQASGEWTWEKFEEYCERLTRDTDGDGENDVYGYVGFEEDTVNALNFSNGAQYIKKGEDGLFYNAMTEPQFAEAIQFGQSLYQRGYWCPDPEGANWDWFLTGFHDGHGAMIFRGAYDSDQAFADMEDDFGMVFAPKGPRNEDYASYFEANVICLPSSVSAEEADELMFAYNLYTEPLQYDLENPEAWKDGAWGYNRWRDDRAVDETLTMLYEGRYVPNYSNLVPGIDWGPTFLWDALKGAQTANERIEAAKPVVDAAILEANN